MRRLLVVTSLVCLLLCGRAANAALKLGEQVGPVELTTHDDRILTMRNYDERPATAVLFLSPRCQVTEKSIAQIVALHQKYRLRNVLFVGIVPDGSVTSGELNDFKQKRGVIFPVYRDPQGRATKQFGPKVTPEVYLLDRKAKLIHHAGLSDAKDREGLEKAIRSVLKRKDVRPTESPAQGTPLGSSAAKIKRDDPYGRLSFSSELIFERIPQAPAVHCSVIEQAPNGDLLCVWYGGNYESGDDQTVYLSRRPKGSRDWSPPEVLIEDSLQPPGNAVIFSDNRERVWLLWCRMERTRPIRRGGGWNRCRMMSRYSDDNGHHWSEDKVMFEEELWAVPRNRPLITGDRKIVLPVEAVTATEEGSTFLVSSDNGDSWSIGGFTGGGSQPAVVQRQDGSLLALMRKYPRITQITSPDLGKTWSKAEKTPLKNPNAGISMISLKNGHWVLVFNDTDDARTPLSIARSLDEGRSWEAPLKLEANPGEYSYPSILQTDDGKIHITYTFRRYSIKHVELNEDWLEHLVRPN